MSDIRQHPTSHSAIYTPAERARRDASPWTLVQGVLAPLQFLVFLISLVLVINYLSNGTGFSAATASVVAKTAVLYLIMITGAIWEKDVFGRHLYMLPIDPQYSELEKLGKKEQARIRNGQNYRN